MAKVLIPTPLRQYAGKHDSVELTGSTVGEVLGALTTQHPDLRQQLYNNEGKLRSFVNVYLNDEDIRYLQKDATPVKDGDTVSIVPSIAGGSVAALPEPVTAELSKDEILRYSRHLIMPEVGTEGQLKLKTAKVLLVGTGGLGAPLGLYLAAAGVGRIGLVDFDVVDFTNLQRQVIHGTSDVGRKKLDSAADRMHEINPFVRIDKHEVALSSENALGILRDYDIVVDGTDNFPTRYLVNDVCVLLGKPNVYGSIFRFEGQATVFAYEGGPCYRCLYPEPPPPGLVPSCAEGGVLGVLPGIIGCIQANEILKLVLGKGTSLVGRLLLFNALDMKFRELKLRRDAQCPICGDHPTIKELIDYETFCGIVSEPENTDNPDEVTVQDMKKALDNPGLGIKVIDVREPDEYEIAKVTGVPLLPLSELQNRFTELDPNTQYYLHCKAGVRSLKALGFLRQQGFKYIKSVKGGITAWSDEIDRNVPRY